MGYGPWGLEFWQIITLVFVIAWAFKPHHSKRVHRVFDDFHKRHSREREDMEKALDAYEDALEAAEDKIDQLEDRIRVLERIVTDNHKTDLLNEQVNNLKQA